MNAPLKTMSDLSSEVTKVIVGKMLSGEVDTETGCAALRDLVQAAETRFRHRISHRL